MEVGEFGGGREGGVLGERRGEAGGMGLMGRVEGRAMLMKAARAMTGRDCWAWSTK